MNKKCQVFTPPENVNYLLDSIGYHKDLYGKKIIENACGDGNILKEVVRRYIKDALRKNKNISEIKKGLQQDIYGVEIDEFHYLNCLKNLNDIAFEFGIEEVNWNILNNDFLTQKAESEYDFVVGNPPYINYRDLDEETRVYLKDNFNSCKYGKYDYCYAFVEASIISLKPNGKMAYLIPSSIFKNVYAQELRKIILQSVTKIIDYTTQKLFNEALTSSAILVCSKNSNTQELEYIDVANSKSIRMNKTSLTKKWVFTKNNCNVSSNKKFGDLFTASISIATLFNKAYIIKEFVEDEHYLLVGENKLEKAVIRNAVSPRSLNYDRKELILFPYIYDSYGLKRYTSFDFEKNFPEATKYLMKYQKELGERKSDKSIEWFEYGRTQALAHLNQPKLLMSTVVTKSVKVYSIDKESIPYSGIYIIPKSNVPLSKAKEILESEKFLDYVKGIGINASGSSLRITAVDINNFELE